MESSTNTIEIRPPAASGAVATAIAAAPVSLRTWFSLFAAYLLGLGLIALWLRHAGIGGEQAGAAWYLLKFTAYMSVCCTFLPLPTGPMIIFLSGPGASIAPGSFWLTVFAVALSGAIGSTMANLNDYHIMVGMLRYQRLARVRNTRLYAVAVRWFERAPFTLQVIFNILPVPVDVVRFLAASHGYSRRYFAVANFIGRFIRYGVLAGLTFYFRLGWRAMLVMLGVAAAMALARIAAGHTTRLVKKFVRV